MNAVTHIQLLVVVVLLAIVCMSVYGVDVEARGQWVSFSLTLPHCLELGSLAEPEAHFLS